MSRYGCQCDPVDRSRWGVIDRECNHSAFSGYHYTPSDYSACACLKCGRTWRTKAKYVRELRDLKRDGRGGLRFR